MSNVFFKRRIFVGFHKDWSGLICLIFVVTNAHTRVVAVNNPQCERECCRHFRTVLPKVTLLMFILFYLFDDCGHFKVTDFIGQPDFHSILVHRISQTGLQAFITSRVLIL